MTRKAACTPRMSPIIYALHSRTLSILDFILWYCHRYFTVGVTSSFLVMSYYTLIFDQVESLQLHALECFPLRRDSLRTFRPPRLLC